MGRDLKPTYVFGPFELDSGERQLRRDGVAVILTPKSFDLLLVLVEHAGHLLEKETLLKAVWPDSFVEENNLADNISKLRKALGDGENGQRCIETVPKRGYRFVAEARTRISAEAPLPTTGTRLQGSIAPSPPAESGIDSVPTTPVVSVELEERPAEVRHRSRWRWIAGIVVTGALTCTALFHFLRPAPEPRYAISRIIPFTSFPGREFHPAFSPDGNQLAFVWDGDKGENLDIYTKLIDAERPLRLTTHPSADLGPVWSPDGRRIAFLRQEGGQFNIMLIPATGGAERQLATKASDLSLSWSPDGRFLAFSDRGARDEPSALFLLELETGEKTKLTSPPAAHFGDNAPRFSPDGKLLAFTRSRTRMTEEIRLMPATGGESSRLLVNASGLYGLTWSANGSDILYSTRGPRGGGLWRVAASGGKPSLLREFESGLFDLTVSKQGQFAYTRMRVDRGIMRVELADPDRPSGVPTRLNFSTRDDYAARFSPDGRRVAIESSRSGNYEIWICDSEGKNAVQLTSSGDSPAGSPSWSHDGRQVAFDSRRDGQADIYTVSADGGRPRQLTTEDSDEVRPSWSHDGRWIYFGSNRTGTWQVYKRGVESGNTIQLTRNGGRESFESTDGNFVYYSKREGGVWRVPSGGGEETPVLEATQDWTLAPRGIYFVKPRPQQAICFFDFSTHSLTPVVPIEKNKVGSVAVSSDGRRLLYTQPDETDSDIMLLDNGG